jgi:N-acetylglucosamine malate deacetylase 1
MRILVLGAHPDDMEFAMAGTMLKLVDEGHSVTGVVLTKGEMGTRGTPELRKEEMRNAAAIVGYTLEMLDFKDTKIVDNPESREIIANIIRKHTPEIVFAPYHTNTASHRDGLAHPDHTTTGNLVRNALRIAKFQKVELEHPSHLVRHLIYYMIPRNKAPTFVNDVSKYVEKMKEAMKAHQSQITEVEDRLMLFRKMYGSIIGVEYGEGFIVEDPMKFAVSVFN